MVGVGVDSNDVAGTGSVVAPWRFVEAKGMRAMYQVSPLRTDVSMPAPTASVTDFTPFEIDQLKSIMGTFELCDKSVTLP